MGKYKRYAQSSVLNHQSILRDYYLLIALIIFFIPFVVLIIGIKAHNLAHFPYKATFASLALFISRRAIMKARWYKADDLLIKYRLALKATLCLGLIFLILQYFSWRANLGPTAEGINDVIAMVTILHASYFVIAVVGMFVVLKQSSKIGNSVEFFIFFFNMKQSIFLERIFRYWEFLCYIWIVIYFITFLKLII